MSQWQKLADIRRDYGDLSLNEEKIATNPFEQFKQWFAEVIETEKNDPSAMVLSTVDERGLPDSRVVLLKGLDNEAFLFYTNYDSAKGRQLGHLPYAALNFYWPEMARQVRIKGRVERTSVEQSDTYFASRPMSSQIGAIASPQSAVIRDRQFLESAYNQLQAQFENQHAVPRPENWGGYAVFPEEIEFWQGRNNRLHDRIQYTRQDSIWIAKRLAP